MSVKTTWAFFCLFCLKSESDIHSKKKLCIVFVGTCPFYLCSSNWTFAAVKQAIQPGQGQQVKTKQAGSFSFLLSPFSFLLILLFFFFFSFSFSRANSEKKAVASFLEKKKGSQVCVEELSTCTICHEQWSLLGLCNACTRSVWCLEKQVKPGMSPWIWFERAEEEPPSAPP